MTTTIENTSTTWKLYEKILFLFFASYFIAYLFPFDVLLNFAGDNAYENFVRWVGKNILKINYEYSYSETGSGDTIFDYINQFCFSIIGLFIFIIWFALGIKKNNYNKTLLWISFFIRYRLAIHMLSYGFAKVFPGQFSFPGFNVLAETYGESSPMRLAWTFMGYSQGYTMFSGILEVIAGLLLMVRKTTLIGAIVTIAVMTNVVMINFCYDVPVKLFSSNLLLMAVFIFSADIKRVVSFLANKTVEPKIYLQYFKNKKLRIAALVLQIIFICSMFCIQASQNIEAVNTYGPYAPKPPLYGLYTIETFVKNGDTLAPLTTDSVRWKTFIIPRPKTAFIRTMTEKLEKKTYEVDSIKNVMKIYAYNDTIVQFKFNYKKVDSDNIELNGFYKKDTLYIKLKKVDDSKFLLVNRGFHWVNEVPFNK